MRSQERFLNQVFCFRRISDEVANVPGDCWTVLFRLVYWIGCQHPCSLMPNHFNGCDPGHSEKFGTNSQHDRTSSCVTESSATNTVETFVARGIPGGYNRMNLSESTEAGESRTDLQKPSYFKEGVVFQIIQKKTYCTISKQACK